MKICGAILFAVVALALPLAVLAAENREKKFRVFDCAGALVELSSCLPYLAAPPNDLFHSPSSLCCHTVIALTESGRTACLCHLLLDRSLLGFPVNSTRLVDLLFLCSPGINSTAQVFLPSLCKGSMDLPPLHKPTDSGGFNTPPQPVNSSEEEDTKSSGTNVLIEKRRCRAWTGEKLALFISSCLLLFLTVILTVLVCFAIFRIHGASPPQ